MSDFDHILKELGELYAFNREIQNFKFIEKGSYKATGSVEMRVAEDAPEYRTGND